MRAALQRGKIVTATKLVIDRSKFPTANDDYTPSQRRIVDARLAESDEDIKHRRIYGPFNTAEEMAASVEANIRRLRAAKRQTKAV
jgi:hypothetical protein